jgi:hypothetical protein
MFFRGQQSDAGAPPGRPAGEAGGVSQTGLAWVVLALVALPTPARARRSASRKKQCPRHLGRHRTARRPTHRRIDRAGKATELRKPYFPRELAVGRSLIDLSGFLNESHNTILANLRRSAIRLDRSYEK